MIRFLEWLKTKRLSLDKSRVLPYKYLVKVDNIAIGSNDVNEIARMQQLLHMAYDEVSVYCYDEKNKEFIETTVLEIIADYKEECIKLTNENTKLTKYMQKELKRKQELEEKAKAEETEQITVEYKTE